MSDDTLLAHLNRRLGHGSENLATEALEYILRHRQVADAFERHLRQVAPNLPHLVRYQTQVSGSDDTGIRDLIGKTESNTNPFVLEVKFGAPLTPNQPVTYLNALTQCDEPSLLLFLVPSTNVSGLWPRLLRRCAEADLQLELHDGAAGPTATIDRATMAITTWSRLLDDLSGIPLSTDNAQVLSEITQLRGLCAREDREGFTPFGHAFLEGDTGRHLINLEALITEAVDVLHQEGKANARGPKRSAGHRWFGKQFSLAGREARLYVNYTQWGVLADTPLWLRLFPDKSDPHVASALGPLRDSKPQLLFDWDGVPRIAVFLPPDGDREECLEAIVEAVRQVHALLAELPEPPPATPDDPGDNENFADEV